MTLLKIIEDAINAPFDAFWNLVDQVEPHLEAATNQVIDEVAVMVGVQMPLPAGRLEAAIERLSAPSPSAGQPKPKDDRLPVAQKPQAPAPDKMPRTTWWTYCKGVWTEVTQEDDPDLSTWESAIEDLEL